jgi:hypothetical protein
MFWRGCACGRLPAAWRLLLVCLCMHAGFMHAGVLVHACRRARGTEPLTRRKWSGSARRRCSRSRRTAFHGVNCYSAHMQLPTRTLQSAMACHLHLAQAPHPLPSLCLYHKLPNAAHFLAPKACAEEFWGRGLTEMSVDALAAQPVGVADG